VTTKPEGLLPSAKDFAKKLALAEAEKAAKEARKHEADDADRQDLIKRLQGPSGVSDEEAIRRAVRMIERAVEHGQTEVQVYRFPNQLCTDRGRAINQREPGWENTLTGVPKEVYRVWEKYFRPEGYKLRVQIIDFPGGFPGDVGMTLSWT
jgi:hypothetical protein